MLISGIVYYVLKSKIQTYMEKQEVQIHSKLCVCIKMISDAMKWFLHLFLAECLKGYQYYFQFSCPISYYMSIYNIILRFIKLRRTLGNFGIDCLTY